MAKSYYKGESFGKHPMCAICGGRGNGPRAELHLSHGISVWLCAEHRSDEFQRSRAGRDFTASLSHVWRAAGRMTRRHQQALDAHRRRILLPCPDEKAKGSYAWKDLRREAERRFAAGEDPKKVITELAAWPIRGASGPSYRTLRRWFTDGRWMHLPGNTTDACGDTQSRTAAPGGRAKRRRERNAADDADRPRARVTTRPIRGPC